MLSNSGPRPAAARIGHARASEGVTRVPEGLTRPAVSLVPRRRQIRGLCDGAEPGHRQHRQH